jgi:hypothetical protein
MDKDDEDVCQLDVPKKRRCRGKNAGVKKALFDEQITRNTLGDINFFFVSRVYCDF